MAVSRNFAVTKETCTEVNVVISRTDDAVNGVVVAEAAAGGGVQVVASTSGKQVEGRNSSYWYDLELAELQSG